MSKDLEGKNTNVQHDDTYVKAEKARYEAEAQPSKTSEWPLVSFTEKDGVKSPIYREKL